MTEVEGVVRFSEMQLHDNILHDVFLITEFVISFIVSCAPYE